MCFVCRVFLPSTCFEIIGPTSGCVSRRSCPHALQKSASGFSYLGSETQKAARRLVWRDRFLWVADRTLLSSPSQLRRQSSDQIRSTDFYILLNVLRKSIGHLFLQMRGNNPLIVLTHYKVFISWIDTWNHPVFLVFLAQMHPEGWRPQCAQLGGVVDAEATSTECPQTICETFPFRFFLSVFEKTPCPHLLKSLFRQNWKPQRMAPAPPAVIGSWSKELSSRTGHGETGRPPAIHAVLLSWKSAESKRSF